ncbi:hypothetical protein M3Y95_00175700 [Aphelenchoides besseyi]|nr:hypothetical protein M3Y95_00175700 [Aphelenchoides besseyi]
MSILTIFVVFLLSQTHNSVHSQPHHPTPPTTTPHGHVHGRFGSKDEINDIEHLKLHIEDKIEFKKDTFDPTHSKFHYFNLHNLNKDAYIDGLELMKGITHGHDGTPLQLPMSDSEIELMVDQVLQDFDKDGNGLVSYSEYAAHSEREMQ